MLAHATHADDSDEADTILTPPREPGRMWIVVLAALLGLSFLLNVVLVLRSL